MSRRIGESYGTRRLVFQILTPLELASENRHLLTILHIKYRTTTTGCSKAQRGLRFLLEVT